jgi:hypothetical protein
MKLIRVSFRGAINQCAIYGFTNESSYIYTYIYIL